MQARTHTCIIHRHTHLHGLDCTPLASFKLHSTSHELY
uniref:Uncharacterized protein n=1 Tax=Anguilla anguilla TaxID=7936 RepID=A0A0E9QXK8_ANGAN